MRSELDEIYCDSSCFCATSNQSINMRVRSLLANSGRLVPNHFSSQLFGWKRFVSKLYRNSWTIALALLNGESHWWHDFARKHFANSAYDYWKRNVFVRSDPTTVSRKIRCTVSHFDDTATRNTQNSVNETMSHTASAPERFYACNVSTSLQVAYNIHML